MSHGERRTARSLGISSPCPLTLDNSARGRSSLKNAEAGNFFCAWQRQRDQRPGFRSSEPAQPYLAEQVQPGREDVPGMLRPTIQRSDTLHCKYCSSIYYKEKKYPLLGILFTVTHECTMFLLFTVKCCNSIFFWRIIL